MAKKFVVYVTYGVYVDAPDDLDPETAEGEQLIREQAIGKMFGHGYHEVVTSGCDVEIEDVTDEFEYLGAEVNG